MFRRRPAVEREIVELDQERLDVPNQPDPQSLPIARSMRVKSREKLAASYAARIADCLAANPGVLPDIDYAGIADQLTAAHVDRMTLPPITGRQTYEEEVEITRQYMPGSDAAEQLYVTRMAALGRPLLEQ